MITEGDAPTLEADDASTDKTAFLLRVSYALFIFAVLSKLWAPLAEQYKLHYISYFLCAIPLGVSVFLRRASSGQAVMEIRRLLLFFAYLFVSAIWAYSPTTTLVSTLTDCLYLLVFWIAYVFFLNLSRPQLSRVLEVIPYGVAAVSVWGIATFGNVRQEGLDDTTGMGSASTILSFHLTAAIPFLIRTRYLRPRTLATIALIATIPLTLLLQSRSALGANLLVAGITVVDFNRRFRRRILLLALGAAAATLLVVAIFATVDFDENNLMGRIQHATNFSFLDAEEELKHPELEAEDLQRRLLWLVAYNAFVEHPYLGIGYGGVSDRFDDQFGYPLSSHGFITTLLSETGLVGTVVFIFVLVGYFRRIGRAIKGGTSESEITFLKAARAGMIGLLVVGLFHQVYQDQLFYILLAWGYAAPEMINGRVGEPSTLRS